MISKNDKCLKGKKSIALLLILLLIGFAVVFPNFMGNSKVSENVSIEDNKTPLASGENTSKSTYANNGSTSDMNVEFVNNNAVATLNSVGRVSFNSTLNTVKSVSTENNNVVNPNVIGNDVIVPSDLNEEEVQPEQPSDSEQEAVVPSEPEQPELSDKEETQQPEEPSKPALTAKDGIEWLEKQLNTKGSDLYNYFHGGKGDTFNGSLDSNGYNFAPNVNEALLKEFGLDNMDSITYRIWKDKSNGQYNIFWADCGIKNNGNGDSIESTVTKYNTKDKVYIEGTATVTVKNDGKDNLCTIDGSSFKEKEATKEEKDIKFVKTVKTIGQENINEEKTVVENEMKADTEQVTDEKNVSDEEVTEVEIINEEAEVSAENDTEETMTEETYEQIENVVENQNADLVISEME